jgi:hypothetical protein
MNKWRIDFKLYKLLFRRRHQLFEIRHDVGLRTFAQILNCITRLIMHRWATKFASAVTADKAVSIMLCRRAAPCMWPATSSVQCSYTCTVYSCEMQHFRNANIKKLSNEPKKNLPQSYKFRLAIRIHGRTSSLLQRRLISGVASKRPSFSVKQKKTVCATD